MAGKTPRPQATRERILTPRLTRCPECGRKKRARGIRPLERAVEGGEEEAEIVPGDCAAVRSAQSRDGRSPLEAGGLKLEARLSAVSHSLDRVAEKRGGSPSLWNR
jgi:hypothetical protein